MTEAGLGNGARLALVGAGHGILNPKGLSERPSATLAGFGPVEIADRGPLDACVRRKIRSERSITPDPGITLNHGVALNSEAEQGPMWSRRVGQTARR